MLDPSKADLCPQCHQLQLPRWIPDSHEIARACQACGYIEEKPKP